MLWQKDRVGNRLGGISRARLLDNMIHSIHFVVPGTPVPVVVSSEVEDAGTSHIKRNIEIIYLAIFGMPAVKCCFCLLNSAVFSIYE